MTSSSSQTVAETSGDRATRRTRILTNHLLHRHHQNTAAPGLLSNACLSYTPPELNGENRFEFDTREMRKLLDFHNIEDRDWLLGLMRQSRLFISPRGEGKDGDERVFVSADYNQSKEQQREVTMKRVAYLLERGVFSGWLTGKGPDSEFRKLALLEVTGMFDHSLSIKIGVHFFLWSVQ